MTWLQNHLAAVRRLPASSLHTGLFRHRRTLIEEGEREEAWLSKSIGFLLTLDLLL